MEPPRGGRGEQEATFKLGLAGKKAFEAEARPKPLALKR